ncbi:MAG: HAD family hydrolase [Firmicutes bacterium]|nr:HAD family hydrolase [Bacillota bacterium]
MKRYDPRGAAFTRLGRFNPDEGECRLWWSGSGLRTRFDGARLQLEATVAEGEHTPWLAVTTDGVPVARLPLMPGTHRYDLLGQMERFGILPYFDTVLGLTHIYATDKTGIALEWLENSCTDPADCVMVGDTLHDADVARSLGCRCILVSGGHQSRSTLLTAGCTVTDSLKAAADIIMENSER